MQGLDIILGGTMISLCLVISLVMVGVARAKKPEKAAKRRVKWLRKRLKTFNLSYCWRWHYRLGYRRGKKRGIEIGRELGAQHIEVVNRCRPHAADLVPQVVQLYDGRMVQAWFCPYWEGHIMQPYPETHAFPAARFMQEKEIHQWQVAATDTQLHQAVPKKVRLS